MVIKFESGHQMTLIPRQRYSSGVIRVDEEVYAEIAKRGRGFNATPNSVLREVFGLPPVLDGRTRKARERKGGE